MQRLVCGLNHRYQFLLRRVPFQLLPMLLIRYWSRPPSDRVHVDCVLVRMQNLPQLFRMQTHEDCIFQ